MNRNVTAIYRTHSTADLVRRELEKLGVSRSDIHVVPDTESPATDRERYMDDLHDLHLPDDDVRTYQHSVRSGDHVVSANVDEDQVEHARRIMSRPEAEAYDLGARETEFRDETLIAHSDAARSRFAARLGRRARGIQRSLMSARTRDVRRSIAIPACKTHCPKGMNP